MKVGFAPVADQHTRLFILGSLPGDKSLERGEYYGHHTNQFWRLVGALIGQPLHSLTYPERLDCLRVHGIGLWDVFQAADRQGSADSAIRGGCHNALAGLVDDYPQLCAIAFNGGTAAKEGRRYFPREGPVALINLPSSSGLNAMGFAAKLDAWKRLTSFLADL